MNDPTLTRFLRLCARPEWDAGRLPALADAAVRLTAWDELPPAADAHGLAPLVSWHCGQAGIDLPASVRRDLFAMGCLHRDANRARFRFLGEVIDAFNAAAIPVIVLKGAALAHLVYPSIELRPLSDIDLLVERSSVSRALAVLAHLRCAVPPVPGAGLERHHHLPAAVALVDGVEVRIEIHVNALTLDTPGTLAFEDMTGPPQPFVVGGQQAFAFGHADMLYHLCRHMAEPSRLLRLIWIADIVGYATRYRDAIPWADLRRQYPFVLNALALVHLVVGLPGELLERVAPAAADLRGVGRACKPLSEIFKPGRSVRDVWPDVFDPSDWWLRLYYGLDDRATLWWHRSVRHPVHVGRWLVRRAALSLQPGSR